MYTFPFSLNLSDYAYIKPAILDPPKLINLCSLVMRIALLKNELSPVQAQEE
jgi:hypothetical protein